MNSEDGKNDQADSLPEAVRNRLKELSGKLDSERQSLNEATMMREAEAASLQTELKKREEAWSAEREQLKKELAGLKAEKEALAKQYEGSAADKETIASLEEEAKGRAQAWNTERTQLKKDAENIREELRAERKQWSDIRAEWKAKFDKMVETAKTGAERETFLSEKLRAAESTVQKLEPELQRREDEYRRALSQMETDQQKQMNAALGALDEMLSKKDKKKDGPK